ncbi:MAG: HIT family protein [Gammaproteobacteria bacterium]
MASIFTRIISGELPSYKIAEDDCFFAFLDINPLKEGHTLVVPKIEQDYLFDINDQTLKDLIVFSKRVAKAVEKSIPCDRIGVTVIGLEVPHAHIHLIPISEINDMSFNKPKLVIDGERMSSIQKLIISHFE